MAIAGLHGCAQVGTDAPKAEKKKDQVLWPAPPDQPRFRFVGILRSAADILQKNEEFNLQQAVANRETKISDKPVIYKPSGIAVRNGLVYVAEPAAKAITVFDLAHRKLFRFGRRPPNQLKLPQALALDAEGQVYVLDSALKSVVVFDALGLFVYAIPLGTVFTNPVGVAVSPNGQTVYVVDRGDLANDDHKVVAFAPDGSERFRIGPRGSENGKFNIPLAAEVDKDGNLFVVDAGNFRVQSFDANGNFRFAFGSVGVELGRFSRPRSIAIDSESNIYIADGSFNNVQIFNSSGQLLMPLGGLSHEPRPGNFAMIAGIAVDETNRLFIVDHYFRKIEVYRRLSEEEGISLVAPG